MSRFAVIATHERLTHQVYWGKAFGDGLKKHGWRVGLYNRDHFSSVPTCDLFVMWGIRRQDLIKQQKARGREVCILERGYILNRFQYASVSFGGGLNGRGIYRGPLNDPSRWQQHFAHTMKPWREQEGHALIMGQVPGDTAVANVDMPAFYKKAALAFCDLGIPTRFREHPRFHKTERPLEKDLANARCVVTWNSNSATDAVLAGIPAIAMDEGSMAWPVTGHSFFPPPKPDRTQWATALAWKQWRDDEMTTGYCWEQINAG